jgi:hypothetical protein
MTTFNKNFQSIVIQIQRKQKKKENDKKIHHKTKIDTSLFLFSNMKVKSLQLELNKQMQN